jgi:hypothetical protein
MQNANGFTVKVFFGAIKSTVTGNTYPIAILPELQQAALEGERSYYSLAYLTRLANECREATPAELVELREQFANEDGWNTAVFEALSVRECIAALARNLKAGDKVYTSRGEVAVIREVYPNIRGELYAKAGRDAYPIEQLRRAPDAAPVDNYANWE